MDAQTANREAQAAPLPGMLEAGNIDLGNRPRVKNDDGSISTVRSIGINMEGREYLIPTVSDDGRVVSDDEAIAMFQRTGKHLGAFETPEAATAYAESLHDQQAAALGKPSEDRNFASDLGRQALGSIYRGVGSTVRGAGKAAQLVGDYITTPAVNAVLGSNYRTANLGDAPADALQSYGSRIQADVSQQTKDAVRASTPSGNLANPSTWSMGDDPSIEGYLGLGADLLGSQFPVLLTSLALAPLAAGARMAATAGVGGAQGGGAAVEQARETIDKMDRDGTLGQESALYRQLRDAGESHESARDQVRDAAENMAYMLTAPLSAAGGAATGAVLHPAGRALAGRGVASAAAGRAGLGGFEEAVQETGEGIQTARGINAGAGTDLDVMDGSFGNAVMGAMAGAPGGGVAGALQAGGEAGPGAAPRTLDVEQLDRAGVDAAADDAGYTVDIGAPQIVEVDKGQAAPPQAIGTEAPVMGQGPAENTALPDLQPGQPTTWQGRDVTFLGYDARRPDPRGPLARIDTGQRSFFVPASELDVETAAVSAPAEPAADLLHSSGRPFMLRSSAQRAADQHGNAEVVRQGEGFVARPRVADTAPAESRAEDPPGPFGPVFRGLEGNTQGALEKLLSEQTGEAPGALFHPHVGPIDLIWGKAPVGKQEGFGIAKLALKHPEVLDDLQGFISRLSYDPEGSGPNRIRLKDETGRALVSLNWRGEPKTWLLTAFEEGAGDGTRIDTATLDSADDTASRRPDQENIGQNDDTGKNDTPSEFAPSTPAVRTGLQSVKAQKHVDRIMRGFPGADIPVRVVQSVDEIPNAAKPSPGAQGAYYRGSKEIFVIAGNIENYARLQQVVAHELVGHYGVEKLLGDKFKGVLADVWRLAQAPDGAHVPLDVGPEHKFYASAQAVHALYGELTREQKATEILARMAEQNDRRILLQRVYAQLRNALRAMGITVKLSEGDLRQMIVDAARELRRTRGR